MARDDRSAEFTAVLGFFIAITTVLVALRVYCKIFLVKSFAADDYFSVLTLVSFLVFCTTANLGLQHGTAKRRYLTPEKDYPIGMKWWWACEPIYVFANICLKLSIGIFLLRIAVERSHRLILWSSLIIIEVYSVFFFFLFLFQCTPVSYFWEQFTGGTGHCINTQIIVGTFYGYSALSCVADWIFSIVPIFIVRKLQMDRQKKITVGIILAFCAIGSTATIVRLPYISGLNDIPEFLYSTTDVAIWSACETGIGLAASAAATLRPLLRKVFGEISISGGSSSRKLSQNWGGAKPSRSGYLPHPSHGDDNEIPLKENMSRLGRSESAKHAHVTVATDLSRATSSVGLRSWEKDTEDNHSAESVPMSGGILKTVHITQS
ncbi:hypothetical protein GRF29_164g966336 [Pseudopithomyces chartarum]|uniref:Rhodopsin domain-containing protein n=1 Tax=Pseudopithomyces chartarum TaxID=1892770 RepID=A0AAN6LQC2_9PLEO|nr:hypothetical protein GRF29_164g966336 [Pseudopithomyces chartarum]